MSDSKISKLPIVLACGVVLLSALVAYAVYDGSFSDLSHRHGQGDGLSAESRLRADASPAASEERRGEQTGEVLGDDADISSEAQPVREPAIRFVSFGDFGTGGGVQYRVAQAIKQKCERSGCDFAVTLGDNIYNDGVRSVQDPQFQSKFEKPFAPLNFRFHMSLGNHDYRGNVDAQVAYTQKSKKWYLPARFYQFSGGPVDFFALDTNRPQAKQKAWLKQKLQQSQAAWKIAFGHHPRYTYSVYKNAQGQGLIQFLDTLCGQADLYLAGHEHDKQHLKSLCGPEYLIVGTGGGRRKVGKGPNTLYASNRFGFAWFEVTPSRLYFELLDDKGEVEYSYQKRK